MIDTKGGELPTGPVNRELIVVEEITFEQMSTYPKCKDLLVYVNDLESSCDLSVFIQSPKAAKYYHQWVWASQIVIAIESNTHRVLEQIFVLLYF